ncbi:major facilitator superfamily transporter [Purpureocillium lavendulum]|uniref:Major facilitator superfamily transporter n=1 Tax=Purpureocillium lavendulum TaxID=1247861 RepID=A0AB34FNW9_9HYPO|nr:major facilitator superfamily transporter [Purpureocillium lavendulum]
MVSQPEPSPSSSALAHSHHHSSRRGHHHHPSSAASSVVSRPSLSRTKRYGRSHAGGASYVPQNEFPVFAHSGDVEILVRAGAAENRYLLHRHTLTRCSGFFEASTSSEWSKARPQQQQQQPLLAGGNELTRIGEDPAAALLSDRLVDAEAAAPGHAGAPRRRWRYELDPGAGDDDIPMLIQKDDARGCDDSASAARPALPSIFGGGGSSVGASAPKSSLRKGAGAHGHTSSMPSNHVSFSRSVANLSLAPNLSQADEDLLRDYDNLFRIFYNYPPVLDAINVADAYVQCKSLLALADLYDALPVVGPRVDHHLLQFQSRLWKQIAKYPISYLRLGYLARSKVIFQEALIHVVGQWPAGERSLRAALPDVVLDTIEDKVDELEEAVSRVEGRLFRLNLTTPRGDRVGPSNSYLDWLAISLFRQWLADNTAPQPPPPDRNGRHNHHQHHHPSLPPAVPPLTSVGRAYRTLGSGSPAAFLGHDECKRFLKLTPELYSRDNLRRFEKRIDELKAMARDIVRPLLGSGLELDLAGSSRTSDSIGYLTCTAVGNRDLPWLTDS